MPDIPHDEHAESEQIEVTEAMVLAGLAAMEGAGNMGDWMFLAAGLDEQLTNARAIVTAIYRTMEIQKRFGEE